MSYLALYRRFRPQGFDSLIGQEHIVRILTNQIKQDKIGHAYLFSGTRGTGKTSAAKIFAKAINCLEPVNGSPCQKCKACIALNESNNIDIIEIDAASNNRVDEIREIREKVQYTPINVRKKVYIIDEVHMLTDSAFNALLKTLEEPPSHVVFILATTEPQKLPQTILSRCMRFDFKLIGEKELVKLITKIYKEIKLSATNDAITLIARAGEGSVRDTLSVADKCVAYSSEKLEYEDVLQVLGSADKGKIIEIADNIIKGQVGAVLSSIDDLLNLGKSITILSRDLTAIFRDLCIIKTIDKANDILVYPVERFNEMVKLVKDEDVQNIIRCLDIFSKLDGQLRYSTNPRVMLEVCALKCSKKSNDLSNDGLISRIVSLEAEIKRLKLAKPKVQYVKEGTSENVKGSNVQNVAKVTKTEKAEKTEKVEKAVAPKKTTANTENVFSLLIKKIKSANNHLLSHVIKDADGIVKGDTLILIPETKTAQDMFSNADIQKMIKEYLDEIAPGIKLKVDELAKKEDTLKNDLNKLEKDLNIKIDIK